MAHSIDICSGVKVDIGCHYSKFVKVYKKEKFVTLSLKAWRFVENNAELITKSLMDNSDFGLELTDAKRLRVAMFRNMRFVTFCEDFRKNEQQLTKYVSLTKDEWMAMKQKLAAIKHVLDYDVVYQDEYGDWCPFDSKATPSLDVTSNMRIIPRMCSDTFAIQLNAFLITEEIKRNLKKDCWGCSVDSKEAEAHSRNGHGCHSTWEEIVDAKFEETKSTINLAAVISAVNTRTGWSMELKKLPEDKELRSVIVNHQLLDSCTCCTELLPIYWDLYFSLVL